MIERAKNAEFINAVMNHEAVRPALLGPQGPLDITHVVENPSHLVLVGQYGGMIFFQHIPGLFEIHTQVLPQGRGQWALQMAHEAADWLFSKTNAIEIFTRVPESNLAALGLVRACGLKLEQKAIQTLNGQSVDVYGGRIQDWIRIAPGLVERGRDFHSRLHAKYAALGLPVDTHGPSDWHDRHVGAAVGMVMGGQVGKGVAYFNRWAAMAMAPHMKVLSMRPLLIDITDSVIRVDGDDFQVEPCQRES